MAEQVRDHKKSKLWVKHEEKQPEWTPVAILNNDTLEENAKWWEAKGYKVLISEDGKLPANAM